MAHVYQSKNSKGKVHPKYRFQYIDYTGRRRTGTGTTSKKETKEIAEKVEAEHALIRNGYKEAPKAVTKNLKLNYSDIAEEYIDWGKIQGGRGGKPWGKGHLRNRERHLPWWQTELKLRKISDLNGCLVEVEKAIRKLMRNGRSGKTIANYVDSLKSFCNYCVEREYLEMNPLNKMKNIDSTPRKIRRCLSKDEINKLFEVIDKDHYRLLYLMALSTGLRANELRQLTIHDLDLEEQGLILHADWTKNRKAGFQPVPEFLLEDLKNFASENTATELYEKYHAEEESHPEYPLLFVPHDTVYALNKYLKDAGIPKKTSRGVVDFHAFRVTYINMIVGSGATAKTAQTLARHSTVDMTLNVYGRTDQDNLRKSIEHISSIIYA